MRIPPLLFPLVGLLAIWVLPSAVQAALLPGSSKVTPELIEIGKLPTWINVTRLPPSFDISKIRTLPDFTKPPPTPQRVYMNHSLLIRLAQPFMPVLVDGVAKFRYTKPDFINNWKLNPNTIPALDENWNIFQQIVPWAQPKFFRAMLDQGERKQWPYSSIGKLIVYDGRTCTATLVGLDIVLTASHCIPDSSAAGFVEFVPAYDGEAVDDAKRPFGSSYVTRCFSVKPPPIDGRDYAVCQLQVPLGYLVSNVTWRASPNDSFYLSGQWTSVGYPQNVGDVSAVETGVSIAAIENSGTGDDAKMLSTTPFVDFGWSGGPLFGWDDEDGVYIVGVASAKVGVSEAGQFLEKTSTHAGGMRMGRMIVLPPDKWGNDTSPI